MLSDELLGYIREQSGVPKADLVKAMVKRGFSKEEIESQIGELVKQGKLAERKRGRSTYLVPTQDSLFSMLQRILESQARVERALGILDDDFEKQFEAAYQKLKDVAGIAMIRDIRNFMNMEPSAFYPKFEKIAHRYKLSPGGEEGLVIDGNVWGVVMGNARS